MELSKQILKSTSCKATLRKSQTLDAEWSTPVQSQHKDLQDKVVKKTQELSIPDTDNQRRHSLTSVPITDEIQSKLRPRSKSTCDALIEEQKGNLNLHLESSIT